MAPVHCVISSFFSKAALLCVCTRFEHTQRTNISTSTFALYKCELSLSCASQKCTNSTSRLHSTSSPATCVTSPRRTCDLGHLNFCSVACLLLFFVSFGTEYLQEMRAIEALKAATPMSYACMEGASSESFSWMHRILWHASGLQDVSERVCWEQVQQQRVASLVPWPNPMHCFVNLFWKTLVGSGKDWPLAHWFSRQSYVVQCCLIVTGGVVIGTLVYNWALKLPSFFATLVQLPDLHRKETFDELQQQMRENALKIPPTAAAAYRKARNAQQKKRRDWKLAAYTLMTQNNSKMKEF